MIVGVARLRLYMPENESLKDKRRVVKSLIEKVRRRFNVAIAEVDDLDLWRRAMLGMCCVSTSYSHAEQILNRVTQWIDSETHGQLIHYEFEFL